jgi:hypothetical protein
MKANSPLQIYVFDSKWLILSNQLNNKINHKLKLKTVWFVNIKI